MRALLGEQSDRNTDALLERNVGGRVGSQGLSVLSVRCYPLLPGLLLGFPREFTFSVNIFGSQPGRELLHASPRSVQREELEK